MNEHEVRVLGELAALDFSNFSEADVRELFLRPLVTLLGYYKDRNYSVDTEEQFKLHPAFLRIGRRNVALDYLTGIRRQFFWLIEAKDGNPKRKEALSEDDVLQAYFYSLLPQVNCRYFAVSNGWLFNLYDRDALDERFTPLLTIRHSELPRRFLELDRYLGATQLITTTKQALLVQIEKVLSAEVSLERLDEFSRAVSSLTHKVRPVVLQNFRANASSEKRSSSEALNALLADQRPWEIVETLFSSTSTGGEVRLVGAAIADKLVATPGFSNHFLLFSKVFLEDLKPVRFWYYINCVNLLIVLVRRGVETVDYACKGNRQANVRELLHDYLRLVLTRFNGRRDVRYLTVFEGLIVRTLTRAHVLSPAARQAIAQAVEFGRFMLPEEEVAWQGPSPAGVIERIIDNATLRACGEFLQRNYDALRREMKYEMAEQELTSLTREAARLEEDSQAQYQEISRELGMEWSAGVSSHGVFSEWDPIIAGTLEVLSGHDVLLAELPADIKRLIGHVIAIGAAGGKRELSGRHGISVAQYSPDQMRTLREEFFSLDYSPEDRALPE